MAVEKTIRIRRNGALLECLPEFLDLPLETLPWDNLAELRHFVEPVKTGPGRVVVRLRHDPYGQPVDVYIKRYCYCELGRQIRQVFGFSRASNEWNVLRAARARGIDVARPVLVGTRRLGFLLRECFLVTQGVERSPTAETLVARLSGAERNEAIRRIGRVVGELHRRGLFHHDLRPPHLLFREGRIPSSGLKGVTLIDLYRSSVGRRPSMRQRGINLAQVFLDLPGARSTDQARLLEGALKASPDGSTERRRLWRAFQLGLTVRRQRRRSKRRQRQHAASWKTG